MNANRREFLQCFANASIRAISLAAIGTVTGSAKQAVCSLKSPTLAQEYLSIESSIGATEADCKDLSGLVSRSLTRIQPSITRLNLLELRKWEAVNVLNQIGESFNQEKFRFAPRSTLLCTSLRRKILACHYAACLIYAIGEEMGLPFSMLKVPSHVFLRLRLGNGEDLNWDIYLKDNGITADDDFYRRLFRIDKPTAKRGGYLTSLTRDEMLALEYNAVGVAWMMKGEWDHATESFSKAIVLDSRMSEALKNRGCAKYHRAALSNGNEEMQREELYSAITDFQQALKINDNYAEALYSLGQTHFVLNELDAAKFFLNAAEKLNPGYGRSTLSLALGRIRR